MTPMYRTFGAYIYSYFGDWMMSPITAQAIDAFIDHLRMKPGKRSKSFGKKPNEIPKFSSLIIENAKLLGNRDSKRCAGTQRNAPIRMLTVTQRMPYKV